VPVIVVVIMIVVVITVVVPPIPVFLLLVVVQLAKVAMRVSMGFDRPLVVEDYLVILFSPLESSGKPHSVFSAPLP
jgi:hypothetical protein